MSLNVISRRAELGTVLEEQRKNIKKEMALIKSDLYLHHLFIYRVWP